MNTVKLTDFTFGLPVLVRERRMSQSVFYRRLKSITGQTVVDFIRAVRMKCTAASQSRSGTGTAA